MNDLTVFTVDEYSDRLREVQKSKTGDGIVRGLRMYWVFDNRGLALDFMVGRAQKYLLTAKAEVKRAERRLKKCQKLA